MIPILDVQCEFGKFHAIRTRHRSLVIKLVRAQCKNGCGGPWGPKVEGFVSVRALSIFNESPDESLGERVELHMGASNNAIPFPLQ